MSSTPKVSICCITYNHENFIKDTIEGFLSQKTDFPFEIIIHDDCSTDNTRKVIDHYHNSNPDKIRIIYQKENIKSKGKAIFPITFESAKGKYIALCEGDDYWTDPNKLQKQVNFLEENSDYIVCYHNATIIDESGELLSNSKLPNHLQRDFSSFELIKGVMLLPLTMCFRNVIKEVPWEYNQVLNGDKFLISLLGNYGKGKYLGDIIPSVYRKHSNSIWSSLDDFRQLFSNTNTLSWLHRFYKRIGNQFYENEFKKDFLSNFNQIASLITMKTLEEHVDIITKLFSNYNDMLTNENLEFLRSTINNVNKNYILPIPEASYNFPHTTIVIPVFNGDSTLSLCLDSISYLRYPKDKLEVIVVDNGSTDASVAIASNYEVTLLQNLSIKSSYAARNTGISAAKGDLIVFTDADCIVTPDWLTHLAAPWEDKTIGCFAGEIEAYQPDDLIEKFSDRQGILRQQGTLDCPYLPYTQTANTAYRRSVFDQIGLFDPSMTSGGDADICWRMQKELGLHIKFIPEALVYHKHRTSIEGLFHQFRKYEFGKSYWQEKYFDYKMPSLPQRKQELENSLAQLTSTLVSNSEKFIKDQIDFVDLCTPFLKYIVSLGTCKARYEIESNTISATKNFISVIIPTYNRSALLAESLKSLIKQNFPSEQYEILVVDNNSTDNTREVTESFASNSPVSVRYNFEKEQGLSIARNTGIRNAKGEIIAFVDDDIHADENWLSAIAKAYEDPSVGCAGGPIRPIWLGQKPSWLDKMWEPYLTINEFEAARVAGEYRWPETPWGANISFRKNVFDRVGMFPENLGRVGVSLLSNEEVNICKKIAAAGIKIAYAPEAVIHHKIPAERLTKQWFYHRTYWQGRSDAILDNGEGFPLKQGMERRIKNWVVTSEALGSSSFPARCFKRIALGYVHQKMFTDNQILTKPTLGDYRLLLAGIEKQHLIRRQDTQPPSKNSRIPWQFEKDPNTKTNILMISPLLPTFDRDSGSFRLFQIIRILAQQGHKITFIAMGAAGSFDASPYITALTTLGVKVYPLDPERLSVQIGKKVKQPRLDLDRIFRETCFDIAYIYFYHTAALYLPLIRANSPHTSIIVDSVDFHFIREKRNAELHNNAKLLEQAYQTREQELLIYSLADSVIAVTEEDKKLLLAEKPDLTVHVIPNIHPVENVIPPCKGREGVLFIGNFFHDPNIDAVMYLCREIWPLVQLRLPDAKLYVVGNSPPEQIRKLAGNGIIVTGYVPDTCDYLRNCMVSVSPLRYGAGMKGKVGEALAAGIPVVASTVAAEGTGLTDRMHVHIADDPASFAAAIIYLHENNEYWDHLSRNGNNFIRENFTPDAVSETVLRLFARKESHWQVSSSTPSAEAPDNPYSEYAKVTSPESEENKIQLSGSSYCSDDAISICMYNDLVSAISTFPDEEKIVSIQQFIRTMPNSALAHNDLAVLYYQTGNKLQALGHYEKALRLAPKDRTIRKNIASFYFVEMGRTDDAIGIYTDLLKESPDDTEALAALGIISTTLGRAEEAEIFLGKVVELEPWNHEARKALSGLTDTLGNSGYVTSATQSMQQPVSIDENLAQVNSNLTQPTNTKQDDDSEGAQKLLEEGRTEEAIALLENSLGNKPGNPVLHNDLGVLYQKIGNLQKSLEHYEMAVAHSPGNPLFQKNLASFIYVLLGKTDEAVNMYTDLLKNHPEDTEVLGALAIISSNNNRPEEACIFLKRILALEPDNMDAHSLMLQLDPVAAQSIYNSSQLGEQANGLNETSVPNDYRYYREDVLPDVSIVILTFNQLDKTRDCIDSIRRHTPVAHEIIFIDNGSTDGTTAWLRELCIKNDNYTLIENKENKGFSTGCNQGIKAAVGEYVLLLNNDIVVTENWLDGLLECLLLMPNGGIAGPMSNNISGVQQVPRVQYDSVEELDAFALRFRENNRHRRIPYRRIVGFCMLFRKSLIDKTGYFDESFGSGNFEDDDFCLRAELEGFRNVIAGDVFIHHVGSATFKGNNIDFTSAMTGNRKIFNDKWSRQVRNENEALKILTLKTLEKAETLYQRGETGTAIDTLLKEGISNASKENRFYFALADYFIDQERFNDALDTLKELPESAEGQRKNVLLGRALAGMGNLEEAKKFTKSALLINPSSAPALTLLGRIAYDSGQKLEAISHFDAAITADPGYGEPYTCLGLIALQEDRQEDAVNLLEKGFLYLPLSADAANHYHVLVTASGTYDRAETLFREIHSFYPQYRRGHFLLIDILIRQEKYQQAIAEIEQACTIFGIEDGMLTAGLDLRQKIGPLSVDPKKKKAGTSVSLCMIIKNEEKNLPRCLQSLKPIVDELIIVDTGSTDRCRIIAELFGARVFDYPWNGDFSAARNVSLEHATGNWILVMDADEVIAPQDHEHFRQLLKTSTGKNTAFEVTTRNYMTKMNAEHWQANDGLYPEQEAGGGWIPSNKVRLFTNLKTIRFTNPIHELVDQSLAQARITARKSSIPVHHYGYLDKERQQEKGEKYYLLGKKKLAETGENDCTALSELAIQAGEIGRYAEAVELWSKVLELVPDLPLAYFNLGFVYLQMGKFTESRDASAKAMKLKRNYYEAVNNYAMAELCLGNHDEALRVLKKTLATKPDYPNALAMLAVTRLYSNKKDEGLKLFRKLSDHDVVFVEFINESVKKLISAQRINEARTILDTALGHGYGNEKMYEINTSLQRGL